MGRCIALLMVLGLLGGCISGAESSLEVQRLRLVQTRAGDRYVECRIKNPNPHPIANAQLVFSLFDAQNRRVGQLVLSVPRLEPGQTVTCSRYVELPEARTVRLRRAVRF
ncbi:MAG: FxLYD domain-containing protein [Bacteroidota bacterium]|nr:FxLYD domain-containing protein [Rhodothermia bacterium]MDW8286054.1 FxLYD domain-containing protein [Bacteroidota bacterium]